jgi:hypothetical protein
MNLAANIKLPVDTITTAKNPEEALANETKSAAAI